MTVTRDRGFKRLVRARMGRTGESYAVARARLLQRGSPAGGPVGLATMTRRELEELPDADLVASCMGPIQRRLHGGDPAPPATAIRELTSGQGALLAFWILYGHAGRGLSGFCAEMPHRLVHEGYWTLLEMGLRRIGAHDLLSLAHRLRAEVARALAEDGFPEGLGSDGDLDREGFERLVEALARLDPEVMEGLDDRYREVAPGSLGQVARCIREHPDEFAAAEGLAGGSR